MGRVRGKRSSSMLAKALRRVGPNQRDWIGYVHASGHINMGLGKTVCKYE